MEKLPSCVLSDVFVRLKAKQLAQMRSVSKSWNSHLSHPLFIKHHLDHSSVHHSNHGETHNIPSYLESISIRDMACADGHNGHLHWHAHSTLKIAKQRILAFDLGAETFREIPLPDALLDETMYYMGDNLGVFTGKLCVMSTFRASESTKCELWVMDEYGVAESWVKLLDISPGEFTPRGLYHTMSSFFKIRKVILLCTIQLQPQLNSSCFAVEMKGYTELFDMLIVLYGCHLLVPAAVASPSFHFEVCI